MTAIFRLYVEKKAPYAIEAKGLLNDIQDNLRPRDLQNLRVFCRYDIEGVSRLSVKNALYTVFAEPALDLVYWDELPPLDYAFGVEYLPGQFDQRADSAEQCLRLLNPDDTPTIKAAKIYGFTGNLSAAELTKIKNYCINPVDSREADFALPQTLKMETVKPADVKRLTGFITLKTDQLAELHKQMGLAMSIEDLAFVQKYFKYEERDPSLTEIKVIDTYWSDHCRHTTFLTEISEVSLADGAYTPAVKASYERYLKSRKIVYGDNEAGKARCLMDLATVAMKEMRKYGQLEDLDASDEINACSIKVEIPVGANGQTEKWLLMFKNETHNHPTEIEPFGGAATCLGGAIRDPLSGRAYVYQAMRVTGCADPRTPLEQTLPGKLPQRKITREAARGYSSYGNQIGLATGQVTELYHEDFVAKRMEIGAVIAAAPAANVIRQSPAVGDVVVLLGGKTGRDGCGGATGSSKEHDESSLATCGAEVQKGNAPTERKLQRLFRNPQCSRLIKRCNDFGAGGVAVAIGELTDGLDINLDAIPKKYEGLDGTELAISESQERMAIVIAENDVPEIMSLAASENLEATVVAQVTAQRRLQMSWRGDLIVDIARDFLDSNGIRQQVAVKYLSPDADENYFLKIPAYAENADSTAQAWLANLAVLQHAGQKGLAEQFDSTIGAATVLMPFGGKYQLTPALGMAAHLPTCGNKTTAASLMSFGYNPQLAKWSPYHGAIYAVTEAIVKLVAMGAAPWGIRLSCQEYFEKLGKDPEKWGKPFSALLGALEAQFAFNAPSIGGKDSMSGSFGELSVPPTLAAFAVATVNDSIDIISPEFKRAGSHLIFLPLTVDRYEVPNFEQVKTTLDLVYQLNRQRLVLSAQTIDSSGIAGALSKMSFGNKIGCALEDEWPRDLLFAPDLGSLILELDGNIKPESLAGLLAESEYVYLGVTRPDPYIYVNEEKISIEDCIAAWSEPLEGIFPSKAPLTTEQAPVVQYKEPPRIQPLHKTAQPRVLIPAFPGTNCEYDTARAFTDAGAEAKILVFCNQNAADIRASIEELAQEIKKAQIIALPGGFSAGDEPDGSGKFICAIFKNAFIKEAVTRHLQEQDGLMLGICNGFQALIKLGLVPYGEIRNIDETSPTLSFNTIGRHISWVCRTKVTSTLSPWFSACDSKTIYHIPISHGEGRLIADEKILSELAQNGQIATQYVDENGIPSLNPEVTPNGSLWAIEGITSPDGRILGKMGHSERVQPGVLKNIPGQKFQPIFKGGVDYFK